MDAYIYRYIYIYIYIFVFSYVVLLAEQAAQPLMQSINASTQPRTEENKNNKPYNPNRSPTLPQQLWQRPKKATGSVRVTTQEARANGNEQIGQATQAQLNNSSSGQRPKSHGEQAGNDPGGKHERTERTRTNTNGPGESVSGWRRSWQLQPNGLRSRG